MKISLNVIKTSVYNGNLTYTINLLTALATCFPENRYQLLTQLNKKKEVVASFTESSALQYRNILANEGMLGKKAKLFLHSFNQTVTRLAASRSDLYHASNPTDFPDGITNGVVTLHDLIALHPEPWSSSESIKFYHNNIKAILKQAKVVFTVSEFTKTDAIKHFPEFAHKYFPTPLAANPLFRKINISRDFLLRYGITDAEKPYLLYVGEIQPRKNIEGFLAAFDALPMTMQKELQIIIVGSAKRHENLRQFQNAVAAMKYPAKVIHLQNVPTEELIKLYNAAYAFIYLSHYEGFGLPVIEAMSCGCPVLTSNTTSLREVASDAALTVNPDDKDAIVHAMTSIIDQSSVRDSLKEKGFLRAGCFSWEKTAEKTIAGYKEAIAMCIV